MNVRQIKKSAKQSKLIKSDLSDLIQNKNDTKKMISNDRTKQSNNNKTNNRKQPSNNNNNNEETVDQNNSSSGRTDKTLIRDIKQNNISDGDSKEINARIKKEESDTNDGSGDDDNNSDINDGCSEAESDSNTTNKLKDKNANMYPKVVFDIGLVKGQLERYYSCYERERIKIFEEFLNNLVVCTNEKTSSSFLYRCYLRYARTHHHTNAYGKVIKHIELFKTLLRDLFTDYEIKNNNTSRGWKLGVPK